MKKILLTLVVLLVYAATADGQTYLTLWKQANEAEQQDLPRTQYDVLMKIVQKARNEHQPGQLMKAELQGVKVMTGISPDSLLPAVERMEQRLENENDAVLKTVYQVVLRRIYLDNSELERTPQDITLTPELCKQLAAVKAVDYEPLTVKGADSRIFDDDLLSVIGYELEQYQPLHTYYSGMGNRKATFLTALQMLRQQRPLGRVAQKKSEYLHRVDSLIDEYGDLTECGEAAIEHYRYLNKYTDATAEEKWQYINFALDRWGSWKGMNELRNSQRELTLPIFQAYLTSAENIPNREMAIEFSSLRNIHQLTMRLYSVKAQGDTELNPSYAEGYRKIKPLLTPLPFDVTHKYVGKTEYEVFKDSMTLQGLPEGVYMIEIETQPATQVVRQLYYVSNVRVLVEGLPENKIRYVVVNATTGQPLKRAHVKLSYGKKTLKTLTTDEQGEVVWQVENQRPRYVFAYTNEDKFSRSANANSYFNYYDNQRHQERTELFTDRAIYRPGQIVHAAAIVYATDNGYEHKVVEGKTLTLTLRDANYKVVSEQKVTTDRFGTCAADFTLPTGLLNGHFTLQAPNGSCSFRVEEYKRPTFEVKFPEVNQHYEDGDTVQVRATARSFAGVAVQNAKVHYTVMRRRAWWWLSYNSYWNQGYIGTSSVDEEVASGDTMTDGNGTFVVDMPMVLPPSLYPQFYNFVCTADVTDQAGETHQAQLSLPLGNRKTAFSVDISEKLLIEDAPKMTFHQRNAAGIDISTTLSYRFDGGKWQTANTQQPIAITQLKSGVHTLEAICEQDTLKREFTVFSLDDKRPATKTDNWFYCSDYRFPNDGKPVTVQVGSSAENVHIVYSVLAGNRVLESGAIDKSNELINRKLTYKEEYGDGVLLTFAWVKEGQVYTHDARITRPLPDRKLKLEWKTFRDRLTPGQKEDWKLTVVGPDGKPAAAQLMATLYDKSLDQLQNHYWSLSPYINLQLPRTQWRYAFWAPYSLMGKKDMSWLSVQGWNLTHLDGNIFPRMIKYMGIYSTRRVGGAGLAKGAVYELAEAPVQSASMKEFEGLAMDSNDETLQGRIAGLDIVGNDSEGAEVLKAAGTSDIEEETFEQVQVRENLQETAFFYPQLVTDENGVLTLSFTLPESLTTWRFMGLAHTADLCYGMLEGETVAQKDVMIQPNVPRFVREGDQATISARIFNLGEKTIKGMARMQLIDPETDKVVYETAHPFSLDADSSAAVTFQLEPQTEQLLICRVTASGQGFSDGEQHYLPVLPATERVTVTVPFTQNVPGTKTIDLTKLFPQIQNTPNNQIILNTQNSPKLTIEYTNNPAWLMIQALPAVGHPHDDCAICQAASLYANSLGQYIINQVPQAKKVFEQWKQEPQNDQASTLNSQLQKNQELKNVLLEETPWVMDADHEQEQRQRLADFFDENLMQQRLSTATDKLMALQREDGSWSWWPDMPGSTNMTMTISEILVRLSEMTGTEQPMLDGAFKFLGKEMVDLVKEMKKQEKKGHRQYFPSHTALQWLYICKLDGRQLSSGVQSANDYLIGLLKKETKNQSIYEKAMSSIILDSPLYIKSLKEYTVYKEEMGRYYDTPKAGYSWRDYRIPTQVAAIEAIQRLTPNDRQTLNEMRRWLLQQKRTQAWDTPLNSVDAVYAFLSEKGSVNRDELITAVPTVLKIDGKIVETPKATAGIGYVKTAQTYQSEKVFTAEKSSHGTSWGAVYAQFVQPASDVKDQASGIAIKRELLNADRQPLMTPDVSLKVGERIIVRLTIQSERDYDFVQVQDKRAACLEPLKQLSGYDWRGGYYCSPRDNTTNFFFDRLSKGKHVIETEYYIDRTGHYETGICTVQCAYAPEFRGTTHSQTIKVE